MTWVVEVSAFQAVSSLDGSKNVGELLEREGPEGGLVEPWTPPLEPWAKRLSCLRAPQAQQLMRSAGYESQGWRPRGAALGREHSAERPLLRSSPGQHLLRQGLGPEGHRIGTQLHCPWGSVAPSTPSSPAPGAAYRGPVLPADSWRHSPSVSGMPWAMLLLHTLSGRPWPSFGLTHFTHALYLVLSLNPLCLVRVAGLCSPLPRDPPPCKGPGLQVIPCSVC